MIKIKHKKLAIAAIVLVLGLSIGLLSFIGATSLSDTLQVFEDGEAISEAIVRPLNSRTFTANTDDFKYSSIQWQIHTENVESSWINISGENDFQIEVTYAMIENALSEKGETAVRCTLLDSENKITMVSNAVGIIAGNPIENTVQGGDLTNNLPKLTAPKKALKLGDQSLFTITIDYLYDTPKVEAIDKTAAYQSYIRTIVNTSTATDLVTVDEPIPQIKGFDTYVKLSGASDAQIYKATEIKQTFEKLNENKVIKVYYRPAEVTYNYRIFFQNTANDQYPNTPSYTGTFTGITFDDTDNDAIIESYADKTKGFIPVPSQNLQIAADGSTTVNLYFERLYYIVLFNVGKGGFGTDAVYAKYDQQVAIPDPIRPGYVFKGWASTENAVTPDIYVDNPSSSIYMLNIPIPPTDEEGKLAPYTTYYAVWETTYTNYTVIYWLENANDDGYEYGGYVKQSALSGTAVSGADAPKYSGNDAQYFKYFAAKSDDKKIVEGDGSTVINVYYVRTTVQVRFDVSGVTYPGHTHDVLNATTTNNFTAPTTTNGCNILDCGKETHVHTEECIVCELQEHTHNAECCTIPVHKHDPKSCEVGNCVHTSHTKECYGFAVGTPSVTTFTSNSEPLSYFIQLGLQDGCIYSRSRTRLGNTTTTYYLYVDGLWYQYQSTPSSYLGSQISNSGNISQGNYTYRYTKYASNVTSSCTHVHTDACYSCGYINHDHTAGCNGVNCKVGYQHIHTESCYNCLSNQHIHTADCYRLTCVYHTASRSSTYGFYDVKYGADLALTKDKAGNPVWNNDTYLWIVNPVSGSSKPTYYSSSPTVRADLTVYGKLPDMAYSKPIHYYEIIDNVKTTNKIKPDYVIHANVSQLTSEDYIEIPGFEFDSGVNGTNQFSIYYNRLSFNITYMDGFSTLLKNETVPFETSLTSYMSYVPTTYPSSLEKDMYVFEGWYIDPSYDPSSKFDMSNPNAYKTMPAHDIILFAKWKPIQHSVVFYTDDSLTEKITTDERGAFVQPGAIDHNSYVDSKNIPQGIKKKNLTFAGWFYLSEKTLKPFDPYNMPVTRDLQLFPAWSSSTIEHYAIYYKLRDGTPDGEEIALPTTGILPSGSSVVFYAKGEPQWYPEIAEIADLNYFPEVSSHTLEIESGGTNEYTFWYVGLKDVAYTIKYTDGATNLPMEGYPDYNGVTTDVINYFKAPFIKGFVPDAFEKRLVATANPDDNVVEFIYTEDSAHAYCHIEYEYQNTDLSSYTKLDWRDYLGLIGTDTYNMSDLVNTGKTTGFHINLEESSLNGEKGITLEQIVDLPEEGAEIVLKYDRDEVDYKVIHQIKDGDVIETEDLKGYYGVTVYPQAKTYSAYKVVGSASKQLILEVDSTKNVLTFYYEYSTVQIQYFRITENTTEGYYEIVNPTDTGFVGGSIDSSLDNVLALGGNPAGSGVLTVGEDYKFFGWYVLDDEGDIVIHTEDGDKNARLVDEKTDPVTLTDNGKKLTPKTTTVDKDDVFVSQDYFALFQEYYTDLEISREDLTEGEEIIYHIVGKSDYDDEEVDIYVTVNADNPDVTIEDLPIGTYTITEEDDWSWRHETPAVEDEKITPDNNEVVFSGEAEDTKWHAKVVKQINDFITKD